MRILYSSSNGSKWMSLARSLMPISSIMLMSLRTGADSASSIMSSRSIDVSRPRPPDGASASSEAIRSMIDSCLPA